MQSPAIKYCRKIAKATNAIAIANWTGLCHVGLLK